MPRSGADWASGNGLTSTAVGEPSTTSMARPLFGSLRMHPLDSSTLSYSMIDAAICNGDFVVVREQQTAENGDIVAALLDDEATVKTFRNENGHIWLIPSRCMTCMRARWLRACRS